MKKKKFLFALTLGLVAIIGQFNTATAQSVVGTALVDGKRIELLSDNTWRYRASGESNSICQAIHARVDFCPGEIGWKPTPAPNNDISAAYRFDDRTYLLFITEDVGLDDGMSRDLMREVVIQYVAVGAEVAVEQIPVHSIIDSEIDGVEAETIVYSAKISGLGLVYSNTIVVEPKLTLQVVLYVVGDEFSDEQEALYQTVLQSVKLK